jgi:hypothetical protein
MRNDIERGDDFGGEGFALLGLNPRCGCPLAVDMTASASAAEDFGSRGLLLEYLPHSSAASAWELAKWPCEHHGVIDSTPLTAVDDDASPASALRLV